MLDRIFRWAERMDAELNESRGKGADPRPLNADDIASFDTAARSRPPTARDIRDLTEYLRRKNKMRWARMQRDFRWGQKHLAKAGVNPEELRWLL